MKTNTLVIRFLLSSLAPLLASCGSIKKESSSDRLADVSARSGRKPADSKPGAAEKSGGAGTADEVDEYATVEISDPLERLNRATFWCNDKMYLALFRPISKGYEKVVPRPVRKGLDNAFANVKFPIRFVSSALQGKFKRAGLETEKFLVNTVFGLGGLIRQSDKIPSLLDLPAEDMGQTFATWGMGHGPYIMIPFLGPSSLRDGVGLLADNALNPVNWAVYWQNPPDWTIIPPSADTLRALPSYLELYDSSKKDSIDPYLAIRNAYGQYRAEAVRK
jgi:phospholipid-binding lipoprotein MlaA